MLEHLFISESFLSQRNHKRADSKLLGVSSHTLLALPAFTDLLRRQFSMDGAQICSITSGVRYILSMCAPAQIMQAVIHAVVIPMQHAGFCKWLWTEKRQSHQNVDISIERLAILEQSDAAVACSWTRRNSVRNGQPLCLLEAPDVAVNVATVIREARDRSSCFNQHRAISPKRLNRSVAQGGGI